MKQRRTQCEARRAMQGPCLDTGPRVSLGDAGTRWQRDHCRGRLPNREVRIIGHASTQRHASSQTQDRCGAAWGAHIGGMPVRDLRPPDPNSLDTVAPFDRHLVGRRRGRTAFRFAEHDFLFREVATRLVDRLAPVRRRFETVAVLGDRGGHVGRRLTASTGVAPTVVCDLSPASLARAVGRPVVADDEALPFAAHSLDLVISNLTLHWVNDLPGCLVQIRRSLKPDGLFLAALFGGDTLTELRTCLMDAELAITDGISPRVSPFASLQDAAHLLQRAGFTLPVADTDVLSVAYGDPWRLLQDLRGMGETNACRERLRHPTRRQVFLETCRLYVERYQHLDGCLPATFQVLYLTGWAPHEDQQKPAQPGSAQQSLATRLGTRERGTGDFAVPG